MKTLSEIILLFVVVLLIGALYMRLLNYLGKRKVENTYFSIHDIFASQSGKIRVLYRTEQDQEVTISIKEGEEIFTGKLKAEEEQVDMEVELHTQSQIELVFRTDSQKIVRKVEVIA